MSGERTALYQRVSTKEQAEDGRSGLVRQEQALRDEARRRGWAVVGAFVDAGASGDLPWDERPDARRLLEACARGEVELVAAEATDRVGRDAIETLLAARELTRLGVALVIAAQGIDTRREGDAFNLQIRAAVAEEDKRRFLARTAAGSRHKARRGEWPGGPPPFGLALVPESDAPRAKNVLAVHEGEAATVHEAARLIVDEGLSTWEAARALNASGHRPRSGVRWTHNRLRAVLLSPALHGEWAYKPKGGEPIPMSIPAVLEPERHAALCAQLDRTSIKVAPREDRRLYPLSGRLLAPCGAPMHGVDRAQHSAAYRCRRRTPEAIRDGTGCDDHPLLAEPTERRVWTELCDYLTDPKRVAADIRAEREHAASDDATREIARLAREADRLREHLDGTVADYLAAGVDPGTVKRAVAKVEAQIAEKDAERQRLGERQARVEAARGRADLLQATYERMSEIRGADAATQRATYERLGVEVHVDGWTECEECDGKGKLARGSLGPVLLAAYERMGLVTRGGVVCPRCRATRRVPTLRIVGYVSDEVSRRSTCSAP